MQKTASRTKSKIPKKYSRPSLRGHREYRVQMTERERGGDTYIFDKELFYLLMERIKVLIYLL